MAEKYIFSNKLHEIEGMFGVEHSSLKEEEKCLFDINSHSWICELINQPFEDIEGLEGEEFAGVIFY